MESVLRKKSLLRMPLNIYIFVYCFASLSLVLIIYLDHLVLLDVYLSCAAAPIGSDKSCHLQKRSVEVATD